MRPPTRKRLPWLFSLALAALLAIPFAAFADNTVVDGDGLTPVAASGLNFGSVCAGTTTIKSVLIAVSRNGAGGSTNVFKDGSTITVSVGAISGSGLSATGGGTITVPSNWAGLSNNTLSNAVSSSVQLVAGAPGSFSGSVIYNAAGVNTSGALTRSSTMIVTANVVNCDSAPPTLQLPSNQTVEATSAAGAMVTFSATATDTSPASPAVTCTPASGSTFALGTTAVACSASDAAGNQAQGGFTVTVQDTTPPKVTVPSNVSSEATGSGGTVITYSGQSATDLVDGSVAVSCRPVSGSTFGLGTTTVTCTASDSRGNSGSSSFDVAISDTTAPILALPSDITEEATGPGGALVSFSASATDLVDGSVAVSCSPASGSTFTLGATPVGCSASDSAGNQAQGGFSVTVVDTTAPSLTVPDSITEEATGPGGAVVSFSASATDLVDGSVAVSCSPASGSTFGLGTTTVTCTASDSRGNTGSASFDVDVVDTTAPMLTLPADQLIEATGQAGAVATFSASATDLVDGSVAVSCSPASGSTFGLGATTVACTATDAAGNQAQGSFTITVEDTTAPSLTVPGNITQEATSAAGAVVSFSASATDLVDGSVAVSCSPASGSTFPLGTTTVSCSATDAAGNSASGSFTVQVVDTTAPTLSVPGNITVPATSPAGAVVNFSATASDIADPSPTVSCTPASGSTFAPGATTVTCTASDASGNTSGPASFLVTVTYQLRGFYQPVDMNGVVNTVKNGSTVPLKFEIFAGATELTSVAEVKATTYKAISCSAAPTDDVELTATGGTSLRYDTTAGQYIFNWQTPKTSGACYRVTMTAKDGTSIFADFKLK